MGSSHGSSTTVVKRLPDYASSYVLAFLDRAATLAAETYVPFWDAVGGSAVTHYPQTANETTALTALETRGRSGNTTIAKASDLVQSIIEGDQLDGSDSEFQGVLTKFHDTFSLAVLNEVVPLVGGSLYYVGDLSGENLAQNLATPLITEYSSRVQRVMTGKNYKRARTDQIRVLSMGIEYAGQPYVDAEILRTAGLHQRHYDQEELNDLYNRWLDEETGPIQKLELLGNAIRALVGTQYTKSEPIYKPNPAMAMVASGVSGAISGAMIGSQVGAGFTGYGAAIGAVAGLALGAMSSQ
jgi:hypothetical protein